MATLLRQLALVSESASISFSDLTRVSAALQKQAARDLSPVWDISATVDGFAKLEDVPVGYWPIIVRDDIGYDAAGIHLDKDNQPFALVSSGDGWSVTTSHETLEMLVDPFGNRLVAGDSPKEDQGRVEFLVEVCDPSEGADFGYTVNGITVSDFYTPHFFDPIRSNGVQYSYTGAIKEPRQVLRGGYLSWHDPVSDHWWQLQFFGAQGQFVDLGKMTASAKEGSLRAQIDRNTEKLAAKFRLGTKAHLQGARSVVDTNQHSSEVEAVALRAQIAEILGKSAAPESGAGEAAAAPKVRRAPRRGQGD
jgi:hypothetical protein